MAIKRNDLTQQITIRVSENLKEKMLYYSLLDRRNLAEWVREVLENKVAELEEKQVR